MAESCLSKQNMVYLGLMAALGQGEALAQQPTKNRQLNRPCAALCGRLKGARPLYSRQMASDPIKTAHDPKANEKVARFLMLRGLDGHGRRAN